MQIETSLLQLLIFLIRNLRAGKTGIKSGGKSPRSPSSLAKSPSSSSLSKSPSGKSPKSPSNLASLSDEALKALKDAIVQEANSEATRKTSTVVKFQDEFPPL